MQSSQPTPLPWCTTKVKAPMLLFMPTFVAAAGVPGARVVAVGALLQCVGAGAAVDQTAPASHVPVTWHVSRTSADRRCTATT